ncbi:MAG: T9SS type A sorting domain-containing protein [Bacteroidetes bacterium]|nr:T9SS type A sorting domain-containing protein [Bacteroidota bacterium]
MVNVLNYSWQASNITINNGQGSNAINASIGSTFTSGSISVAGVNACGTGPMRKLTIKSRVPATPGAITGPTYNVCNSTANYSVPLVVGVYSYSWSPGNLVTNGQGTNNVQVTFPTGFTSSALTVTANTNLCTPGTSTPRALTIFGKPNRPSNITANPTSWCNGAPVSFSVASVSPPPVYSWTIPSGMTMQSGQGGNSINVLWGTGSGIVKVKASNNCGTSSYRSQTFSSTCREGEINTTQESNLQPIVYPNPASTILNIEFYSSINESIPIRLLDVTGKDVLLQMVNANNGSNNISMDINKLARGVYFIEIKTNQQVFRKKVVFD